MAINASVSVAEITAQVEQRFVNKYIEAVLVNQPGVSYEPGTTIDATFLSGEVTQGTGGYERQIFAYLPADQTAYTDDGVALATKGSIFAHDGSAQAINFTHAALVWGTGNVIAMDTPSTDPATGTEGVYTDLPTVTDGAGTGLSVDLTVANDVFVFAISRYGRNYQVGDTITVLEATMEGVGAIAAGGGPAVMQITSVSSNTESGNVIAVAGTTAPVVLDSGNEAAFYWDLKLFGFNS